MTRELARERLSFFSTRASYGIFRKNPETYQPLCQKYYVLIRASHFWWETPVVCISVFYLIITYFITSSTPTTTIQLNSLLLIDKLEIPDTISHCSKMEILDLSHNNINFLPDSLCFLQNLSKLSLNCANLFHLPRSLGNMRSQRFPYLKQYVSIRVLL